MGVLCNNKIGAFVNYFSHNWDAGTNERICENSVLRKIPVYPCVCNWRLSLRLQLAFMPKRRLKTSTHSDPK